MSFEQWALIYPPHCVIIPLIIHSPRAVLENRLSKFSCLTLGQAVPVNYMDKIFWLDVVKLKDAKGNANAVSIIETDISVEFEAALDAATEAKNSGSGSSSSGGDSGLKSASASAAGGSYPVVADAFGDSLAPSASAAAQQTPIAASATASTSSARSPSLVAASSPSLTGKSIHSTCIPLLLTHLPSRAS
jgi:hypothetical protein